MPVNVEVKAQVEDWDALKARVEAIHEGPGQIITQEDMFFNVPQGRLKLRTLAPNPGQQRAQVIYYEREDTPDPKTSTYCIAPTDDPAALRDVLTSALGVRGIVKKQRYLYQVGQTRVHLDRVEGLGTFMELEVVLQPEQTVEQGQRIARALMTKLGVADAALIQCAYIDLQEAH
jgi:predicted adenylyl cyclase CyaB